MKGISLSIGDWVVAVGSLALAFIGAILAAYNIRMGRYEWAAAHIVLVLLMLGNFFFRPSTLILTTPL